MYSLIGYSVNQWAHIDRVFFELTHACLGASEQHTAIIYYRLRNQRERIELAKELLDTIELGPLENDWKSLYARIKSLSAMRNTVAHQPLQLRTHVTNVSHLTPENPIKLENFMWIDVDDKELLRGEKKSKRVEIEDLTDYVSKLVKLTGSATAFLETFKQQLASKTGVTSTISSATTPQS